ncbi:hypothetical protein [Patiriisocius hiemis]|uniref:Glycine dehydrogenase n=1 Tax=Patiriisocius hiemis TaxID=3075604 RepID=A0ABU2YFE7_9FLAO|nr:hypothetical protein [Constantimarinum sp. W242]MDT0556911.1 hypothetical protein [Constantimarinum sp. W242]
MKFFIKYEEATQICDKTQYNEASIWEKIKLNIRMLYCSATRKYSARNAKLTSAIKKSKVKTMPQDQKAAMKERLAKELAN